VVFVGEDELLLKLTALLEFLFGLVFEGHKGRSSHRDGHGSSTET
jgi:hypothetical protein